MTRIMMKNMIRMKLAIIHSLYDNLYYYIEYKSDHLDNMIEMCDRLVERANEMKGILEDEKTRIQ